MADNQMSNLLLGFVGPQLPDKTKEDVQYRIDLDANHTWTKTGKIDVYRRRRLGPGSGFEHGECGAMVGDKFVLLTELFPNEFKKK